MAPGVDPGARERPVTASLHPTGRPAAPDSRRRPGGVTKERRPARGGRHTRRRRPDPASAPGGAPAPSSAGGPRPRRPPRLLPRPRWCERLLLPLRLPHPPRLPPLHPRGKSAASASGWGDRPAPRRPGPATRPGGLHTPADGALRHLAPGDEHYGQRVAVAALVLGIVVVPLSVLCVGLFAGGSP